MKKIIFVILIGLGAWNYFNKQSPPTIVETTATAEKPDVSGVHASTAFLPPFNCDGRIHCSEMTSRAEAEFFVRNCPGTKMDGDHDGDPCENDSRF